MIVHKLDHRNRPSPELATELTPNDAGAVEFIVKHIDDNRSHRRAREATFVDPATNMLAQSAAALFANTADIGEFIAQSQEIARLLFAAMQTRQRISPGDLVVCLFDDNSTGPDPALAILKLDPQSGFRGVPKTTGSQTRIILEEVGDVLSSELHKCAFIVPPSQRAAVGHDLIVLDQQTGRFNATRQIASFFLNSFLHCEVGLNSADLTHRFLQESLAWADAQIAWNVQQKWQFKERIYQVITNELVQGRGRACRVRGEAGGLCRST